VSEDSFRGVFSIETITLIEHDRRVGYGKGIAHEKETFTGTPDENTAKVAPPDTPARPRVRDCGFPIVGIGASAGDLEALEQFLSHVPKSSGMPLSSSSI